MKPSGIRVIWMVLIFVFFFSVSGLATFSHQKVAIVLLYGLGDESFNDTAYDGATKAQGDFGFTLSHVEPEEIAEVEEHFRAFAEDGYDLIIGVGFLQESALEEVAQDYPQINFAIVDGVVQHPNVASLTFKEHEGSFLVGALAGLMTETGTVGFVGGMQVPIIEKFEVGFQEGLAYTNPQAQLLISYAGSFTDPGRGKELAISQHAREADIIYHASGGTGIGVIEAASENDFYAIGVDVDQDFLAPGDVLTSMLKRVDVAVYEVINDVLEDNFQAGILVFGIAEGGVGTSDFNYTRDLIPEEVLFTLEDIKEKIMAGDIVVTDPTVRSQ